MPTWIAGTEESTTVAAGGALPGRGSPATAAPREPAGAWHAVDADTGTVACGTTRFLETWPDRAWTEPGVAERCADCVAKVPLA